MTLTVHTARVSYAGPDRLDITRKSAGPDGIAFAPSWAILRPALDARKLADEARRGMHRDPPIGQMHREAAERIEREAWDRYVPAYTAEMRDSYRTQRRAWDDLLRRGRVVLVCYCTDPERCHRTLLARMLAKLGAANAGEVRALSA